MIRRNTLRGPATVPTGFLPASPPSARAVARAEPFDMMQAAVMLMAFVAVWRIQNLAPVLNSIKIQYFAPALALLAFLADKDPNRGLRRIVNPLLYKLLGVGLIAGLSVPTSLWPGKSFDFFFGDHSKTLLLMVLIAASIRCKADIERYAVMHIAGGVFFSYYVITHFRVSLRSGRLGELIYYDSNDLALLLVCTIPLCVYFLRPGVRLLYRLAATGALALFIYALVQTGSRGGFLGFIACGTYLLFNFTAIPKRVRTYAVGAMLLFLMAFGGDRYWTMMSSLLHPTQDYNWDKDTGRVEIWKRGIGYMLAHPLTGVGARAFQQAEGKISEISERQQYGIGLKWSAAHNSFVEVGAELGVIGLALFLMAISQSWQVVRSLGGNGNGARAGPLAALGHALGGVIVAYCVAGFFLSAGYSAYLYTIFALVLGIIKMQRSAALPAVAVAPAAPGGGSLVWTGLAPGRRRGRRGASPAGRRPGRPPSRLPGPAPVLPTSPHS